MKSFQWNFGLQGFTFFNSVSTADEIPASAVVSARSINLMEGFLQTYNEGSEEKWEISNLDELTL